MSLVTVMLEKNLQAERKVLEHLERTEPSPVPAARICHNSLLTYQEGRVQVLEQQVADAYLSDGCDQD